MTTHKGNTVNVLPALLVIIGIIAVVIVGSLFAFKPDTETIQGQADVTEYRVSSKVPGRILRYYVREGDHVKAGDTLALLEAPDVTAKYDQARAAEAAAQAQREKADKGARQEQKQAAFEMWQKAKAGLAIAEKSYQRVKNLYDQGVMTAQKLDEATAQRDAARATERAARAQYDMARNGAEREDKQAAAALVARAQGAVSEVKSYVDETVLTAFERAGLAVNNKCRVGYCGFCRSRLVKGEYHANRYEQLRIADKQFHYFHPCCSYPMSDMEIEVYSK